MIRALFILLAITPVRAETKSQHERWNDRSVFAISKEQRVCGVYSSVWKTLHLQMKIEFVFSSNAFWLQYPPFYLPPCCFICVVLSDMGQLKCGKIFLWILKTRSPLIVNSLKRGLCAAHAQAYTHQLCFKTSFYFLKTSFCIAAVWGQQEYG